MSDQIAPEVVDARIARDARFRAIDLGIEVEVGLRDNRPLQILMERLRADADTAMEEFATANPADILRIQDLQARIYRFIYTLQTMNAILATGRNAEASVTAEDSFERGRDD